QGGGEGILNGCPSREASGSSGQARGRRQGNGGWKPRPAYSFGTSLGSLVKASSTSSSVIRLDGSPGWLRFCSSVPSPIMPGWGSLGSFSAITVSFALTPRQSGDSA